MICCNCTENTLCDEAKKLHKLKSIKNRRIYARHRMLRLGLTGIVGFDIWANSKNVKPTYRNGNLENY